MSMTTSRNRCVSPTRLMTRVCAAVTALAMATTFQTIPAQANEAAFGPKNAAQCKEPYPKKKRVLDELLTPRVFNDEKLKAEASLLYGKIHTRFLAYCAFGDPGSDEYNTNLARAIIQCKENKEMAEAAYRLARSPYFTKQFDPEPRCSDVEEVAKIYGFDDSALAGAQGDQRASDELVAQIVQNAEQGAPQAMLFAAVKFFDLDNRLQEEIHPPEGTKRGLVWFNRLANAGGEVFIYQYLVEKEKQYKIDINSGITDFHFRFIRQIYEILERREYPPALIRSARSLMAAAAGRVASMETPQKLLDSALDRLEKAKLKASPDEHDQISSLQQQIAAIRPQTTSSSDGVEGLLLLLAGMVVLGALMADNDADAYQAPQVTGFDPCLGSKELVLFDPSMAAPVGLFGCSPY